MIFLIEYNQAEGKTISIKPFDDAQRARAQGERLELELERNRQGVINEVVLLEADNEKALRRTHNRYFQNLSQMLHIPDAETKLRSVG